MITIKSKEPFKYKGFTIILSTLLLDEGDYIPHKGDRLYDGGGIIHRIAIHYGDWMCANYVDKAMHWGIWKRVISYSIKQLKKPPVKEA